MTFICQLCCVNTVCANTAKFCCKLMVIRQIILVTKQTITNDNQCGSEYGPIMNSLLIMLYQKGSSINSFNVIQIGCFVFYHKTCSIIGKMTFKTLQQYAKYGVGEFRYGHAKSPILAIVFVQSRKM